MREIPSQDRVLEKDKKKGRGRPAGWVGNGREENNLFWSHPLISRGRKRAHPPRRNSEKKIAVAIREGPLRD